MIYWICPTVECCVWWAFFTPDPLDWAVLLVSAVLINDHLPLSLSLSLMHATTHTRTFFLSIIGVIICTQQTLPLYLSLSLSLTHTRTHTLSEDQLSLGLFSPPFPLLLALLSFQALLKSSTSSSTSSESLDEFGSISNEIKLELSSSSSSSTKMVSQFQKKVISLSFLALVAVVLFANVFITMWVVTVIGFNMVNIFSNKILIGGGINLPTCVVL